MHHNLSNDAPIWCSILERCTWKGLLKAFKVNIFGLWLNNIDYKPKCSQNLHTKHVNPPFSISTSV